MRILNSEAYRLITGRPPPSNPISAQAYIAAGIPWFNYPETAVPGLHKASKFQRVITMDKIAKRRGELQGDPKFPDMPPDLLGHFKKAMADSMRRSAQKAFSVGKWQEAVVHYSLIIRSFEDVGPIDFLMRSICFYNLARYPESQRDASAALVADPSNPDAIIWHGWSSLALGFPDLALKDAAELLERRQNIEAAQALWDKAIV